MSFNKRPLRDADDITLATSEGGMQHLRVVSLKFNSDSYSSHLLAYNQYLMIQFLLKW